MGVIVKNFIMKQWSRKIAIGMLFWGTGTLFFVLSVFGLFRTEIKFTDWASFTEWVGGLIFIANVGEKAFAKPSGQLFDDKGVQ